MIIDFHNNEDTGSLSFDLCIIGAGAAGITLARKLGGKGFKVCLLEAGGMEVTQDAQMMFEGESTGVKYTSMMASRLRVFGGTTGHWGGQSITFDEMDFHDRDWVPDSGWPISYAEYAQYLPEASMICGVPSAGYRWSDVYSEEKLTLPFDQELFEDALIRYSAPPRRFGFYFRDEIKTDKDVTCLINASVSEIHTDASGSQVTHVSIKSLKGNTGTVKARSYVLACGGIENARLLLASRGTNPAGVGNRHDQLGRYFMEHPNYDSGKVQINNPKLGKTLLTPRIGPQYTKTRLDFKLSPAQQEKQGVLNHSAFLVPANIANSHFEEDIGFIGKVWNKMQKAYDEMTEEEEEQAATGDLTLRTRLEHAPIAASRISLGEKLDALGMPLAKLELHFSELEGKTIEALHAALAKELGKTGIGRMRVDFDPNDTAWQDQLGWQIHHCGGTRMHTSPQAGVVDTNSKVFGVANLYVAGSSIFPTSGHANPTLNLVALTLRLADHIKEETRA
jgi:choline dehydrogenase-like flavoprotein